MKSKAGAKLFIVRKYIFARSAAEAIRKDRITPPDEIFIDDDWRKNSRDGVAAAIGFGAGKADEQ